jgi:phosphohistidine phosphatase SixA
MKGRIEWERRNLSVTASLMLIAMLGSVGAFGQQSDRAAGGASTAGATLIDRMRQGGAVMFIRHADTAGEPCDAYGSAREQQRNISAAGREQATALGERMAELGIPVAAPILAGPVFRARDTAELAFGADRVTVTDSLLADDYAGGRLDWVLSEHRRLFSDPVPRGTNRVLVGHRGPVQMILGSQVSGTRLPEAGVLVLEPKGAAGAQVLGVVEIVPAINGGNPACR